MNLLGRVAVAAIVSALVVISYIFAVEKWDECEEGWTIGIGVFVGTIFAWLLVEKLIEWGLLA